MSTAGNNPGPAQSIAARRMIPFAIATGYGSSAVPARHNDVARLEKPFDPSQVVELVSRWERSRAE